MSVNGKGEWKKWNHASFWGANFVWTTLHDFGCTDGMKGPYGAGMDCFALNRGLLAVIVAAAFVIIGVPSCYYCYKLSKKVEYKPLP